MHEGPFSLHLSLHLLSFVFLTIVIPTSLSPYLIMIFICAFLMTSDVEYIFIYLMVICMSSLKKKNAYSSPFPIFKINFFDIFLLLGCLRSSHVLDINSLSDLWFSSIFPSTSCLFIMMIVFFAVQKHFDIVHLYMFAFDFWAFGATFKKSSPMSRIFPSMFSSSFYSIKYYI